MAVSMGIFGSVISNLNAWGFYAFVLPWLLVFALVYGLIMKLGVLDKKPAGVVSLAIAFFVTAYTGIGAYFVTLSGTAAMLLGALLVVVLFFALLNFDTSKVQDVFKNMWMTAALLIVLALILFLTVGGTWIGGVALTGEMMAAIFVVIIIAFAVWFITDETK